MIWFLIELRLIINKGRVCLRNTCSVTVALFQPIYYYYISQTVLRMVKLKIHGLQSSTRFFRLTNANSVLLKTG